MGGVGGGMYKKGGGGGGMQWKDWDEAEGAGCSEKSEM
jgi:hypothetical protein